MDNTLQFWILATAVTLTVLGLAACFGGREAGMTWLRWLVRRRFPRVNQLSTAELAALLEDSTASGPILLDVRNADEFAVSHLPAAIRVDESRPPVEIIDGLPGDRPVVVYCSVGYRSSRLATRLMAAGFSRVSNLEGSIFQWANEGRPLVRGDETTTVVHPYSAAWQWLVRRGSRASLRRCH